MEPLSAPRARDGTPAELRRRLWRTGAIVVGVSTFASAFFVHLSLTQFGAIVYSHAIIVALVIPLVVASLAFSWIASLTLKLDASRRELDRLAHEDALTGLANRRAALARLDAWAAESGTGDLALAIADIDFFKHVNDTLGHDGGDAGLIHVAGMLRRLSPDTWLVARLGGEEFLLAAPDVAEADFAAHLEALRHAIADTPLITACGPQTLTASFGIAAGREGERVGAIITRADNALYAAKQGGRNRIVRAA